MNPELHIPRDHVAAFCRANGIAQLAIFGSALREDFSAESDIDVLVEFAPWPYARTKVFLESLLNCRICLAGKWMF